MSYKDVKDLLPHRAPFLYVDKLLEVTDERIVGIKKYTEEEYFFKGHFPGYPIVPGVILVESMAQCGGAGAAQSGILENKLFFLATIEKAKFRKQVVPGDEVRFEIENERVTPSGLKQKGKVFVGDQVAAEASWLCLMGEK